MAKPKHTQTANEPAFWGLVTSTHGRHHFVTDEAGNTFEAHRRGKKTDVVVGDTVGCSQPAGGVVAIESVKERRNLFYRSDEWRIKELASNLDLVAVVFASRPSFNPKFIWKAMVAAGVAGVDILVIRNKADLIEKASEAENFLATLDDVGAASVSLSAQERPQEAASLLAGHFAGKRVLLVGQSGMGKSTILNILCPEAKARTQEFSAALDLGKQTTTATRLYATQIDGRKTGIIDSPGFQEFGLAHVTPLEILQAMPDIARCVDGCRFYNCTHTTEPGCSVKTAVEEGRINEERYRFYCELVAAAQR